MDNTPVSVTPPEPRRNIFVRFRGWLRAKPYRLYVCIGVLLVIIAAAIAAAILVRPQPPVEVVPAKPTKKVVVPETIYYSPLTGNKVADSDATKQAVTAIMIENSPDARPQSGLKQAGVVYEAIAEGGITRFLAIYQEAKPQLIGPVRSVRMYFVDWLAPYNASVAHVGGSAAALTEVRNGSYRDIDQFYNGNSYWRATDRYAPHNVYTSFEKLDALNAKKGYLQSSFTGFPRTDGKAAAAPTVTSIDIAFSSPAFNPHYDYDAASNTYLRSVGGQASQDREDGQLAPTVVIAMKVDMSLVMQDGYREAITTTSTGVADIFQNGTLIEGTWQKDSRTSQIKFLDSAGKPISLDRGQTWIEAVPNGSGGVSWQ